MTEPPSNRADVLLDVAGTPIVERIETHVSTVHLGPDDVLKRKKPLRFPFLDFRTAAAREAAAEAEVRLNRRLAPDVYLGVVPLVRDEGGVLRVGGPGSWDARVDVAVHMRRLPDDDRFDVRLARGTLTSDAIERLATRLVHFHEAAEVDVASEGPGGFDVLLGHVDENLASLRELGADACLEGRLDALGEAHLRCLHSLRTTLDARREAGRVRDGHGDLRLDHVYLGSDDELRVLDCVEFDRAFRVADVVADVAFFAMDLRLHGEHALAERFVAQYVRDSADHGLYALLDFFVAYYAMVRAKVTLARAAQLGREAAAGLRADGTRWLVLAEAAHRPPTRVPHLLAFGGVIGSGKSTLARAYGASHAVPVLESDRLRKQLLGVAPETTLAGETAYGTAMTRRVYDELATRAAVVLASGRSVVVDASFRERGDRLRFAALAAGAGAGFTFVACHAPIDTLRARLRARASGPSVSDARVELLDSFVAGYEPIAPEERDHAVELDTTATIASCLARLDAR